MEDKTVKGIPVNDGGGLLDNIGLIDSLIIDCNEAVKALAGGKPIAWCNIMVNMVRKLSNLREGVKAEMDTKNEQLAQARKLCNDILEEKTGLPVDRSNEKDGE